MINQEKESYRKKLKRYASVADKIESAVQELKEQDEGFMIKVGMLSQRILDNWR